MAMKRSPSKKLNPELKRIGSVGSKAQDALSSVAESPRKKVVQPPPTLRSHRLMVTI
jgi:hypothetical protein